MKRMSLSQLKEYFDLISAEDEVVYSAFKQEKNPQLWETYIKAEARLELIRAIQAALAGDSSLLRTYL